METAAGLITQSAHPDANIIWGTAFDENLSDEMRVTVVATGFDNKAADGLRSTLGTSAAGAAAPGVTASAPSAVFSAEVNTPSVASGNASAAKPVEEENSDTSYYDDLLAILNKRR